MIRQMLSIRVWWLGLFLMVGLGIAFYFVLAVGAKSTIAQQLLRRERTIARAEASNITSFFQVFGNSVAVLSQLSSVQNLDSMTLQEDMDAFVEQWRASNLVGGVVLIDTYGKVLFNSNVLGTHDVGMSLADRDYFLWAKGKPAKGEYFIGKPVVSRLGASKGQIIVPIASPVYQDTSFVGAVVAVVRLKPLTERYLELMKVSEMTDVYLVINSAGEIVYNSSDNDRVGSVIFEHLPELKNSLDTLKEGMLESGEHLIGYSPIILGNQNWSLIMVSPTKEVENLTKPFFIRQTAIFILVFLTIMLLEVVTIRETRKRLERSIYQNKL